MRLLRLAAPAVFRARRSPPSLATRMIPVLAADAQRLAEAQRRRPQGRARAARARGWRSCARSSPARSTARIDVAATLEVRGFATARRAPRRARGPRSRHDLAFARVRARDPRARAARRALAGARRFDAYPASARLDRTRPRSSLCAALLARRAAAVRRPPGDRAVSDRCCASSASPTATPATRSPALRDVSLEIEPGEFCLLAGLSGPRQVDAAARRLRARAALPRRPLRGPRDARRPRHARARPRATSGALRRACSSRTPRRRS